MALDITLATNRIQLVNTTLKSSVTYILISRVQPIEEEIYDNTTAPPTLIGIQWWVRLVLPNGVNEDFRLGGLASQPTWANDAAGYAIAEAAIYAAFPSAGGGGSGTVTNTSGGTTGLTFANPTTTPTLGGTLVVANGGTGATDASAARTNLGLVLSAGGNQTADAGKVLIFGPSGGITAFVDGTVSPNGVSTAVIGGPNTNAAIGAQAFDAFAARVANESTTRPALEAVNDDATNVGPLAHFHRDDGLGMEVANDGGLAWTTATGAQTTATNLPAFGTSTKGVVPASGGGTTNFLRADGTWVAPSGGSGTVTSVSVTTANGVSGSVATATTTPAISLTLGAITPTSVAASGAVSGSNLSGTNTGDQTSIVGITGSLSDFNTALTGADFATGGGTATGTNTGDQTNISGNAATVTTNANLTGPITSVGNTTTVAETELSAIAGLTSAADKTIQFTGSGTAALVDLKLGTEVAYSGTITWTAGTAPSSTANLRQFYTQVGNMVTWEIALTYAVAGSTITGISLTFPTEFPTPAIPTGFTGANVKLWQCFPTRLLTSPTSATLNGSTHMIQRNAADTGFEISGSVFASGSYRTFHLGGIYFTN